MPDGMIDEGTVSKLLINFSKAEGHRFSQRLFSAFNPATGDFAIDGANRGVR